MTSTHRRHFLGTSLAWATAGALPLAPWSALGAVEKFDLLIRNAHVMDPSQNLNGLRDIGVRNGKIVALATSLPLDGAARVMDAQRQLVTPGLIDLHCHTYPYGSGIGIPADELMVHQATTTTVSAGDAGANNFAAWRRFVQPASRTRQFAFVHIAVIGLAGFPVPELANLQYAQPEIAARAVTENADLVLGVKVRMSENVIARHGMEPLRRALQACEMSGVPSAKVMVHIGGVSDRALMSQILDALRPGDILTHCYSGATNAAGEGTNIVQDGKLLPAALEAKKRGVIFDVGHGGGSFDYTMAEAAMAQGCMPDTLSSDAHAVSANSPGKPYLPWVMSKFLNMGFSLPEVIKMATTAPAQVIQRIPLHGTLQLGAPADLSILELVQGSVDFVDTRDHHRKGTAYLKPLGTVIAGVVSGRPYQAPFSVR
jgi:dihydroorotase